MRIILGIIAKNNGWNVFSFITNKDVVLIMVTQLIARTPNFVILNNKLFAKYFLIFRITNSYSINNFFQFNHKHQLFFQKIENKNQQLKLMFVDSVFVNILADLALEILLGNVSTFHDYIFAKNKIALVEKSDEEPYFRYKFRDFIDLLLYSNISTSKPFNWEVIMDKVYCYRNSLGELEYFSVFEKAELQRKLLTEMKIEIDYGLSSITSQEIKLCLKIFF